MLKLSGESDTDAETHAGLMLDFETRLAKSSMTRLERRNPHATYNKMQLA
jgi:putative endopeptidase